MRGGACLEDSAQAGRAFLTTQMLDAGAAGRGALEFGDALEQLGASFSARCSQEAINVEVSVLKRNFEKALGLYADAILRPRFDASEWDRVRTLHLQGLQRAEDQPTVVAARVGMRTFFGDAHPYGRPAEGTVSTVQDLSLESIQDCHKQLFNPDGAVFFIAGDLTVEEAKAALEKAFGGWKSASTADDANAVAGKPVFPSPANQSLKVVVVDKPGSVQTVIRFFMPGPTYKNSERVKLELLNTILGGSFTSRLNQNLREKHGFTYGAHSRFVMEPSAGYFTSGADVQTEHTGEALKEFLAEFSRLRKGDVSKEEASKSRETNRIARIQSFQGLSGILNTAAVLEQNGLLFSQLGDDLNAIGATAEAELNKLAGPAVPLEQAVLVLVGDKPSILEQLKNFGASRAGGDDGEWRSEVAELRLSENRCLRTVPCVLARSRGLPRRAHTFARKKIYFGVTAIRTTGYRLKRSSQDGCRRAKNSRRAAGLLANSGSSESFLLNSAASAGSAAS